MTHYDTSAIDQLLEKRYSPRTFSETEIDEGLLLQILGAARFAPSSFNEQPWRFIYATKSQSDHYSNLLSTLAEGNKDWASTAPVLVLAIAKTNFSANEKPNRHAWYDTGAAVAHITLKASSHDIYIHQMAGFSTTKAKELFAIPEGFEAVAMIAMGYNAESEHQSKKKKKLDEIAFRGAWGLK
ncbi:nitroreductase family protein [Porifericola rhodea]|uniref:nitroreductase family protein n=1 Tax=Porifericola rhodea TaxID=930972 RepID=UPI0026660A27|nr:nitroreductase family protein [Porifericola rhodea]WKN31216.1 nitroreductase family protein [Porifericola rhodea]